MFGVLRYSLRQFTDPEELTEFAYAFICSLEAGTASLNGSLLLLQSCLRSRRALSLFNLHIARYQSRLACGRPTGMTRTSKCPACFVAGNRLRPPRA